MENIDINPFDSNRKLVKHSLTETISLSVEPRNKLAFGSLVVEDNHIHTNFIALDSGVSLSHQEFKTNKRIKLIGNEDSIGHGSHLASQVVGNNIGLLTNYLFTSYNVFDQKIHNPKRVTEALLEILNTKIKSDDVNIICLGFEIIKAPIVTPLLKKLIEKGFKIFAPLGNSGELIDLSNYNELKDGLTFVSCLGRDLKPWAKSNYTEHEHLQILGQNILGAHHHDPESYYWMSGTSVSVYLAATKYAIEN